MTDATPTAMLTPEDRALLIGLAFPITNTNGEAEAIGRMIADHLRAHAAQAVAARERELLQEVNQTFCGGLSSSLDLEFMRDMSVRIQVAMEREQCARYIEQLAENHPHLANAYRHAAYNLRATRAGQPGS